MVSVVGWEILGKEFGQLTGGRGLQSVLLVAGSRLTKLRPRQFRKVFFP